jgi:hypothetical protein
MYQEQESEMVINHFIKGKRKVTRRGHFIVDQFASAFLLVRRAAFPPSTDLTRQRHGMNEKD